MTWILESEYGVGTYIGSTLVPDHALNKSDAFYTEII